MIFLGPQGSGKGTEAALIEEFLKKNDSRPVAHFSMGNALREFMAEDGYTAQRTRPSMDRGELQPLFLTGGLFSNFLIRHMTPHTHLIIDGFPRMDTQLILLNSALEFYDRKPVFVVYLSITDEVAIERLVKRGRADDTPEAIKKRLRWTKEQNAPILSWFKANPRYQIIEVDTTPPILETNQAVLKALRFI